jgi:hypothetical protein
LTRGVKELRIKAYILAADPAWIEASVFSYYDIVEDIVVSFDENFMGWTGAPIAVEECLQRLRAIDRDGKMRYCPGPYFRPGFSPMQNDTHQRQCALEQAGNDADWVLQFDTDEVLPHPDALLTVLNYADQQNVSAVEWPIRVLFRRLPGGNYLEVCANNRLDRFEYPGPIAVKPTVRLSDARRTLGPFLRPMVTGDISSLQISRAATENEQRAELLSGLDAIIHNSWARPAESIRSKIASWGHNDGWKSWFFYYIQWLPAPYLWRFMGDFHPFARGLWPALKPCECLPENLVNAAV